MSVAEQTGFFFFFFISPHYDRSSDLRVRYELGGLYIYGEKNPISGENPIRTYTGALTTHTGSLFSTLACVTHM